MKSIKILLPLLFFISFYANSIASEPSYVKGNLTGQLGNQLFVIAAATSLALDHGAVATFPDYITHPPHIDWNIPHNYQMMLYHLTTVIPPQQIKYRYKEPYFHYHPIPYHPNMEISGYFQSEKYFINNKDHIINLFAPDDAIINYLYSKYNDIIDHPYTVAIHFRSYLKEDPEQTIHPTCPFEYFEKAMKLFPENSLFVIFSNDIALCKQKFIKIPQNIRYIEGEDYIYDFYLMSLCKHNIISNSSFSWWAAYLNHNPEKIIIAPFRWFAKNSEINAKDLIPENWLIIDY